MPDVDLPRPPRLSRLLRRANPLHEVIEDVRETIRATREEIHSLGSSLHIEEAPSQQKTTATISEPEPVAKQKAVATACVPCALGHFSTSAGLLNEAVRFKGEGITSNEVLDRIAKTLEEQNSLERVDLTPEKLQRTPEWEREIAEEALGQSRSLRHRLENIESIENLEQAAADTAAYYRKMNRNWFRGRFRHLGKGKAEAIEKRISSEDKERIRKRAEELIEEV